MKEKKQKKALATPDQSDQINEAFLAIEAAIEILRDTGLSTREISLTLTNAEQASMWLQYAANELEVELSTDEDDDEGEEDEGEDEEDGGDEGDDK